MLANNNMQVVNRMAKTTLKSNIRKSFTMIFAVFLSAFMMFSVMTVGVTYFNMQHLQNIRLSGADFDAIMYGITDEQFDMCEKNPEIESKGINAVCGYAISTDRDDTVDVGFIWADDTYWNKMMAPARKFVEGKYPEKENEIMVTEDALKSCGYEELEIGDTITMTYGDISGEYTKKFVISGIWDGYGSTDMFFVSKTFFEHSGNELSNVGCGRYYLDFKKKLMTEKQQNAFIDSMNLGKQQRLFFVSELGYSAQIFFGIIGLILITCLCAYLLIYNIMYLSVSGNVRYYGLLQTIGMTEKQIYHLMQRQMWMIGLSGISGGILVGCIVSFLLIPSIVSSLGIRTGQVGAVEVTFHPGIFLLTILLVGITVYLGSHKPAKMAVSVTPIEALGYRKVQGRKNHHKCGKGKLIWRMAKEQLLKDKKKTTIVMMSLAASLSVFLCLVTMLDSQRARTIVGNAMDMDLVIKNDTLNIQDQNKWEQIITPELTEQIKSNDKVKDVHAQLAVQITVPWEPDFADMWMREFYDCWMMIPYEDEKQEYQEHPENFGSFLVGIDETEFENLNETLEVPVDSEKFLSGEACIIYRNDLTFENSEIKGKKVTCAEYSDASNIRSFEIQGMTDDSSYIGPVEGYPPTIIVIDRVAREFVKEPYVTRLGVVYEKEFDQETEDEIMSLTNTSEYADDYSYSSKIDSMKNVKKAQGDMLPVGIGVALILALIGIMNYVNTVSGSIQNRQVELAVLESIGMTEKQMKKMLIREGFLYAVGSLILMATAGIGIDYVLFQSMNYNGVTFYVPWIPILLMTILIIMVCILIPLVIYRILVKKGSIVERIGGFE